MQSDDNSSHALLVQVGKKKTGSFNTRRKILARIAGKQNLQSSFQKFKEQSEVKKGSKDISSFQKVQRTA